MKIITHSGTATETARAALSSLGVSVHLVSKPSAIPDKYDGLLLLGGSDINPTWYGEKNTHSSHPDKDRDLTEWLMLRRTMTEGKPILGICRGSQWIAIAHGGSLYQDMFRQKITRHHLPEHKINVIGPLADHIPTNLVNSRHHQAIRSAPGFKVLARSEDNIIEAIWKPGILGVQWHPELMFPYDYRWISLFRWFVNGLR